MKRSTWIAVAATALVLIIAGNLPRVPWDASLASLRSAVRHPALAWPVLPRLALPHARPVAARAAVAVVAKRSPAAIASPPAARGGLVSALRGPLGYAGAGALAGLVLLALLLLPFRGGARARVARETRNGRRPAEIARGARMARDAVRLIAHERAAHPGR